MSQAIVIHGRYADQKFTPDEPLPAVEGRADLVVYPQAGTPPSIFDLFGKAPTLRSRDEIEEQLRQDRDEWGDS